MKVSSNTAAFMHISGFKKALCVSISGNEEVRDDFSLSTCYCIVYRSLLMLGWNTTPETLRKRITFLFVLTGGMVFYWLWEAMLISYFSSPTTFLPFNSLEGFLTKSDKKVVIILILI